MSQNRLNTMSNPAAPVTSTPTLALPGAARVHSLQTYHAQVHAQAALCVSLARVLHHALADLDWPLLRFSDRSRLERVLTRLGGDIPLVWLAAAQPQVAQQKSTQTKAIRNKDEDEEENDTQN